ncbi:phosphonate ABC transporter, permease protein PhnE [Rossellomorea vietnamensis]|uniref:Phosphonate ABC transporter, permease protein PhnE n=1 Tax=Rossellomorea vietnamensis TaxID=218284 RepID=A0A5D4M7I4_9BACI|nr:MULTISPECIES: phosphonate ABC transporter, permease protein PhnE [Bacillaceae]TYR97612.1 phosphonate ABC transporter, permease protein PhnE [Rossellomorea vietnamensis]
MKHVQEKGTFSPSLLPGKAKARLSAIFAVIIGFYILSTIKTNATLPDLIEGIPNMGRVIVKFFPPNFEAFQHIVEPMAETIQMAIVATTIASILCIPLSLLAAQNITTNKFVYTFVRSILNILRTIPDMVLAVIFVGLFGIGIFPGIVALIIFSLGILAKLISETIESVDMNPIEAMQASGSNTLQSISFALVPQVLPQFTSFVLYVFEINIRASVVLGLVGAGGIGLVLSQQLKFYNYPNAMLIILVIFAVVVIIEYISTKIREAIV